MSVLVYGTLMRTCTPMNVDFVFISHPVWCNRRCRSICLESLICMQDASFLCILKLLTGSLICSSGDIKVDMSSIFVASSMMNNPVSNDSPKYCPIVHPGLSLYGFKVNAISRHLVLSTVAFCYVLFHTIPFNCPLVWSSTNHSMCFRTQ